MTGSIAAAPGGTETAKQSRTPRILIVDDDLITRMVLEQLLMEAGFDTVPACSVAEAFAAIQECYPDLILLDVHLPDGMGFDVCQKLQSVNATSHIPVLFISSNDDTTTKVKGFDAGAVDYVTKPLAGAEIIARVTTHLRLKQAYDRLSELHAERVQRLVTSQQSLMPRATDFPEARFQVSMNQVLQAGGDFYDVIHVGHQIYDYIVADASGHDLGASFWTASMKALLSEYASSLSTPSKILYSINNTLIRILPEGVFFTAAYARLNRNINRLTLACAGCPPSLIIKSAEQKAEVIRLEADVIGAFNDAEFGIMEMNVKPGDRLYLYTDGLVEIRGSIEKGLKILVESCISRSGEPLETAVQSIVQSLTGGIEPGDDIVLMGVEI